MVFESRRLDKSLLLIMMAYRALVGTRVKFGRTNVGHLSLIIAEFELEDFFELPEDLEPAESVQHSVIINRNRTVR